MRLKLLVLAAIVAISFLGFNLPAANAQPAQITFGEGNYLEPFINTRIWVGMTMLDKYASANGKSDSDTYIGYGGGGEDMGLRMKKGSLFAEASIATKYTQQDDGPAETEFGANSTFVKWTVNPDLVIHIGKGGDALDAGGGDCPPYASPADDGFRGFCFKLGGMMLDANYKGFGFGIMNEGFGGGSSFAPSDATNNPGKANNTDYVIPKMGVSYKYSGPVTAKVYGGYQSKKIDQKTVTTAATEGTYTFVDANGDNIVNDGELTYTPGTEATTSDNPYDGKNIVAYGVGGVVDAHIGAIGVHAHGYYSVNSGEMGEGGNFVEAKADSTDKFSDTVEMGGNFAFSYNVGGMEPAAGVAYKVVSNDNWDKDDPTMAYFVRVKIDLAPGLNMQPGVIITDNMKGSADQKQGKKTQFGIFFEGML